MILISNLILTLILTDLTDFGQSPNCFRNWKFHYENSGAVTAGRYSTVFFSKYIKTESGSDAEVNVVLPQVRTLFLQWIPWVLRMARPGEKITRKTIMMQNKMKELDLKEKSSKSLLANVLDMDDDFVPSSSLPHSHLHHQHSQGANQAQPGPGQQKNGGFIRWFLVAKATLEIAGHGN